MIFNQFGFFFFFLPFVVVLFNLPPLRSWRCLILLCASLVFYGLSGIEHAIVLVLDILWVYFIVRSDRITGNRLLLALAIVPPFIALFYYKYLGFFIDDVLGLAEAETSRGFSLFVDVVLPAGISFFTFQIVAFAIDRYRGQVAWLPPLLRFALYISFFPQLVAGPILRFKQVSESLRNLNAFRLSATDLSAATGYIVSGLALKVLLADTLGHAIAPYTADPANVAPLSGAYVVSAYSFQIYFDFYGYSLIAIGLGRLFGFRFPDNFKMPYSALNARDFWRHWHVTLSYWIRDYLYLPLGGNHRYVRNIVTVFLICGLWHGAGWNFLVWGAYHALLVTSYHYTRAWWDAMPRLIQIAANFSLVSLGWTLFLFDFSELRLFASGVLAGGGDGPLPAPTLENWMFLAISAVVCFGLRIEPIAENKTASVWRELAGNCGFAILLTASLLYLDRSQTFIYFRF